VTNTENFYVLPMVHLSIILVINMHKFLFHNKFIICLYMFRALLCSSSGGQNCIIQHLVLSHSVGGRPVHRLREDRIYALTLIITQQMYYIKFHIKTLKITPTCFDPKIILKELRCSLLKSF